MKPGIVRSVASACVLSATIILAACEDGTGPEHGPPERLVVVSGNAQVGMAGEQLPELLTVRVVDADGDPVPGQLVNFVVVSGGGSVYAGANITNSQGIARERWTLGWGWGMQTVEARAVDNETGEPLLFAVFTAYLDPGEPGDTTIPGEPGDTIIDPCEPCEPCAPCEPDPNEEPILWLQADAIDAADGAPIAVWSDLSGRGHDATQSNAIHQPTFEANGIGGLGSVRFAEDCEINGSLSCPRQFLDIFGIGTEFDEREATLFVVATIDDESYALYATGESHWPPACGINPWDYCDGHWRFLGNPGFEGNGHGYVGTFHRGRIETWPLNTPATGTHLFVLRSGDAFEFLIDGSGPTPMPASFASGMDHSIGAGDLPSDGSTQTQRFFNGLVGEVIVYDRALSDEEMQATTDYLTEKWGL